MIEDAGFAPAKSGSGTTSFLGLLVIAAVEHSSLYHVRDGPLQTQLPLQRGSVNCRQTPQ
jgi:hypothetical protein